VDSDYLVNSIVGHSFVIIDLFSLTWKKNEQILEVVRLEGQPLTHDEALLSRDIHLLQLCTGIDEKSVGSSFQLVFAPIDDFPDETPLISSGFRVIPLDMKTVKCCQIPNYIIHYPFDCSLGPYVLYLLLH
jgi:hypothetical protein